MENTQTVKATFDVSSLEGKMKVYNAQNGASTSMKTLDSGFVIEAVGVLQYQEKTDEYGKEQDVTVTTIFAEDGSAYSSISETVAGAGEKLIDLVNDLKLDAFKVKVIKQKSQKGNEFLNLNLSM